MSNNNQLEQELKAFDECAAVERTRASAEAASDLLAQTEIGFRFELKMSFHRDRALREVLQDVLSSAAARFEDIAAIMDQDAKLPSPHFLRASAQHCRDAIAFVLSAAQEPKP